MLPTLQIGPLVLPIPQFSLLLSLWFGLSLAEKWANKRNFSVDRLYGLVFSGLITGLIGARIAYIFQYPTAFVQSPISIFSLNPGLLNFVSGYLLGILGMLVYSSYFELSIWNALDALTPLLATMAIGLALSHLASGESFGETTNLPWGIYLWGAKRQPTQIYELFAAILIFALIFRWFDSNNQPGKLFLVFTAMTASSRLFLEAFHGDSLTIIGGLRTVQILAWVVLALTLTLLDKISRKV